MLELLLLLQMNKMLLLTRSRCGGKLLLLLLPNLLQMLMLDHVMPIVAAVVPQTLHKR